MVGFPFTWKLELKYHLRRVQQYLEKARATKADDDRKSASAWLEHFAQHAAFDLRRLRECGHLSDRVWGRSIPVLEFSRRANSAAAPVAPRGFDPNREIQEFDFANPMSRSIRPKPLCNELIHSAVMLDCTPGKEPASLIGFMIASTEAAVRVVRYVELSDFFAFVEACVDDGFDPPVDIRPPPI